MFDEEPLYFCVVCVPVTAKASGASRESSSRAKNGSEKKVDYDCEYCRGEHSTYSVHIYCSRGQAVHFYCACCPFHYLLRYAPEIVVEVAPVVVVTVVAVVW
jgi:hypothetical protein